MARFNYILFISLFFIITPFLLFKYLDLNDFKTGKSIQVESITNGKLSKQISKLNFPFIKNQGQFSENVTFAANTPKGNAFVTIKGELVYSLNRTSNKKLKRLVLKEEFINGNVNQITGEEDSITKVNYFTGNESSKWQIGVPTYNFVGLGEVYDGIEIKLKASGNNFEKLFIVKPGADSENIRVRLSGAEKITLNKEGELEINSKIGMVKVSKPFAFQEKEGKKEYIEVAYNLEGDEYGFKLGQYDRSRKVVIDPILAATFLGDDDPLIFDTVNDIVVDSMGNIYACNGTNSPNFPGIGPGSLDDTLDGFTDAYVAKLNPEMTDFLAATYIGGSESDGAGEITLDDLGNVYISGGTSSLDFPGIGPGSADNTLSGEESFIVKLNSDLSAILGSTYLGGSNDDGIGDIRVDGSGNVIVAGGTDSADFPGIGITSADSTFVGGSEAFISKLDSGLNNIIISTFLGGNETEGIGAIDFSSYGNIYVGGSTDSTNFPGVGPGSAQNALVGNRDSFIAQLNSDLTTIFGATYIGGNDNDPMFSLEGFSDMIVDYQDNVFISGRTDLAVNPGIGPNSADDTLDDGINVEGDHLISKLTSDLSTILNSTYVGGKENESIGGQLAHDSMDNVYIIGETFSEDFPGIGPGSADSDIDLADYYVAKYNNELSHLLASTYLGGSSDQERPNSIFIDDNDIVYVAGLTESSNFPGITPESADPTRGANDGVVVKVDPDLSVGCDCNDPGAIHGKFLIFGTFGDDIICGSSKKDLIIGFKGNDCIEGREKKDILLGGKGDDILNGGSGFDFISGGKGNDICVSGEIVKKCEN